MVPKIEGSIRVGTTGTIAALINHEIESSTKSTSNQKPPPPPKRRPQTIPVSVNCGGVSVKKQQRQTCQSSDTSRGKSREKKQMKKKKSQLTAHRIPILSSGDVFSVDSTPDRSKRSNHRGGYGIVEVVDLKCGNHDKEWSRPITDQFKRLSFSRILD